VSIFQKVPLDRNKNGFKKTGTCPDIMMVLRVQGSVTAASAAAAALLLLLLLLAPRVADAQPTSCAPGFFLAASTGCTPCAAMGVGLYS